MAATTHISLHLHPDDPITVSTSHGQVRVDLEIADLFLPPERARTLAAHLLAAAEHLDPDTADLDQIARTLAIATGGAA